MGFEHLYSATVSPSALGPLGVQLRTATDPIWSTSWLSKLMTGGGVTCRDIPACIAQGWLLSLLTVAIHGPSVIYLHLMDSGR